MGDEENLCKVEYLDTLDGVPEETNWIKRAGKAKVTYPNGCTFEGTFDSERIKQGQGVYVWMGPGSEDDETPVEKARYEGNYLNGMRTGLGRMVFPGGDIYEGEFLDNKVSLCFLINLYLKFSRGIQYVDAWRGIIYVQEKW